jgi:hypothetical protein
MYPRYLGFSEPNMNEVDMPLQLAIDGPISMQHIRSQGRAIDHISAIRNSFRQSTSIRNV